MKTFNSFIAERAGGPASPQAALAAQKQGAQNEYNREKKLDRTVSNVSRAGRPNPSPAKNPGVVMGSKPPKAQPVQNKQPTMVNKPAPVAPRRNELERQKEAGKRMDVRGRKPQSRTTTAQPSLKLTGKSSGSGTAQPNAMNRQRAAGEKMRQQQRQKNNGQMSLNVKSQSAPKQSAPTQSTPKPTSNKPKSPTRSKVQPRRSESQQRQDARDNMESRKGGFRGGMKSALGGDVIGMRGKKGETDIEKQERRKMNRKAKADFSRKKVQQAGSAVKNTVGSVARAGLTDRDQDRTQVAGPSGDVSGGSSYQSRTQRN